MSGKEPKNLEESAWQAAAQETENSMKLENEICELRNLVMAMLNDIKSCPFTGCSWNIIFRSEVRGKIDKVFVGDSLTMES